MSKINEFNLEVTNRIIELMELSKQTNRPFLCWDKTGNSAHMPVNFSSKSNYSGVNVLILIHAMMMGGFKTNQWMTMKQANFMGYKVIKGSKPTKIAFYKPYVKNALSDDELEEKKVISFLKPYSVFNVEQLEGFEVSEPVTEDLCGENDNVLAEQYLSIANIKYGLDRACYIPSRDEINMPSKSQFSDYSGFYNVALHELTHWTAHKSRLSRTLSNYSESKSSYAYEELVAEIGSAFLCADVGILQSTQEDHAQYLNSWIAVLKNDTSMVFKAAKDAQKAFNFIQEQAKEKLATAMPLAS